MEKKDIEIIDLTSEQSINQTIVLDDSIESPLPSPEHRRPSTINESPMPSPINDSPIPSPINDSPIASPVTQSPIRPPINESPMPSPVADSPVPSPFDDSPLPSPISTTSPKKVHEPTPKKDPKRIKLKQKAEERLKQKAEEKLLREANRANAANKALDNCTANIDKNILEIVNDAEEETFRTLFDESMVKYRLLEEPKIKNSISWTYKRTEVVDDACVAKYRDASWIIVIMDGSEYLRRLLAYRDNKDGYQSLKTYLGDLRDRSGSDVVLLVYNLANHMKAERAKEAKNYRKTFKDRFEGVRNEVDESPNDPSTVASIGTNDLQDLRLMLEAEFKRSHSKWKMHLEFYERKIELVQIIVRYTLSIARFEVQRKARASTGLDWAINMDKERAVDPTKSTEDLTKLWITQLQQFPQVTLPIAKAIASEYHSPCALLDQYKNLTTTEGETLLAELYVQRNLKRKIGLNISKRIHCFMTCEDPDVHVGLS